MNENKLSNKKCINKYDICRKKLKDGRWAAGSKTDVITDCLITTAEYVKTFGNPVEITDIKR